MGMNNDTRTVTIPYHLAEAVLEVINAMGFLTERLADHAEEEQDMINIVQSHDSVMRISSMLDSHIQAQAVDPPETEPTDVLDTNP